MDRAIVLDADARGDRTTEAAEHEAGRIGADVGACHGMAEVSCQQIDAPQLVECRRQRRGAWVSRRG